MTIRKLVIVLAVIVLGYQLALRGGLLPNTVHRLPAESASPAAPASQTSPGSPDSGNSIAQAYAQHLSGVRVESEGVVERVLSDDNEGSRHQRFIVRVGSGPTVLIAHNIDIAPRIESLRSGDAIAFSGEYEWNDKGGVVHWTHRDPQGRHVAGWIKHDGRVYQ